MLKKIAIADLRLGMHLHSIEGKWLDHPFWRNRFTLEDPADIAALQASPVRECWIDVEQGLDVLASAPVSMHEAPPAAPVVRAAPAPSAAEIRDELQQAAALCRAAKGAVEAMFGEARLGRAIDAEHCLPLVDEIARSVYRNPSALVSVARLKRADDYTYMHSVAVCALMVSLGRQLGFDEARCRDAGLAGLLHDMGKALVPPEILNKPGKLTDEEFAVMRRHPEQGHALLVEGRGAGPVALDVCLHHHERHDGTGYPHRLSSDAFTQVARMGAVCDVYDAITSNRPYKAGWDPAESIAQMARWKGHFDPAVFGAFVHSLGIYPTGSLLRLGSGRLAVVVEQNVGALTTPVVNAFYCANTRRELPVQRVDLADRQDTIVCRESRRDWDGARIEAVWAGATPLP
jgi:HD-GYP domain-containing protein (c-di-GMP phosphodiesterase class II)